MTRFFSHHARDRFMERHGIYPTVLMLSEIALACSDGRAMVMRTNSNGSTTYYWKVGEILTHPVMKDGVIITFLPGDFFIAGTAKRHRQEAGKAVGRAPKAREPKNYIRGEPYRRDRSPVARLLEES